MKLRDVLSWPALLLGLDNQAGKKAWLKALALVALAALLVAYPYWIRPWLGGRQVRSLALEEIDPKAGGLLLLYYPSLDMVGSPQVMGPAGRFAFASKADFPGSRENDFAITWLGAIDIPESGRYGFGGKADDGLEILIDGLPVARDWTEAPPREIWGTVRLKKGLHSLVVRYYQAGGGASLRLKWQPPGRNREPLSRARLTPLKDPRAAAQITRLRLAYGMTPRLPSTYPPLSGGRHWWLPW